MSVGRPLTGPSVGDHCPARQDLRDAGEGPEPGVAAAAANQRGVPRPYPQHVRLHL